MFKFILLIGLISSSQAVTFHIETWYDSLVGSVGRMWGVIVRPNDIDLTRVLTNVNPVTYPGGRNASQVEMVYIRGCSTLTYIPRGMKIFYQNFNRLQLHECGIQYLDSSDFKSYENLKFLVLVRNKLETIPGNLFSLTYACLTDFWAQGNQIKYIEENALINADQLRYVDLSDNICTNGHAFSRAEVQQLSQELRYTCGNYQRTTTRSPCGNSC
jgi:hypothetical protein